MPTSKFEISTKTIIFTTFWLLFLCFVYLVRDIILMLLVAFVLMSALRPTVDKLETFKIPRVLAGLFLFLVMLSLVALFGTLIIPPLVFETSKLIILIPDYLNDALGYISPYFSTLFNQITPFGSNILKFTFGFFSNFLALLMILVISFYLLIERKHLLPLLEAIMEDKTAHKAFRIVEKVEERLGSWVRGQLALGTIVGIMTFFAGLTFLGVPYALPLALIAAVLEIVPNIGPIISTIPAALVALATSPLLALATIALFFLIQQIENNLIVPKIMQKVVGLNPLITIVALLTGGKLMGILGVVMAVPVFLIIQTTFKEVIKK